MAATQPNESWPEIYTPSAPTHVISIATLTGPSGDPNMRTMALNHSAHSETWVSGHLSSHVISGGSHGGVRCVVSSGYELRYMRGMPWGYTPNVNMQCSTERQATDVNSVCASCRHGSQSCPAGICLVGIREHYLEKR